MEGTETLVRRLVKIGVSPSHASLISRGVRNPSLRLAIKIYRRVGVKLGPLVHASKAEIDLLEKVGAKRMAQ